MTSLKSQLRQSMSTQLNAMDSRELVQRSGKICNHITHRLDQTFKKSTHPLTIAVFSAHGAEVDLSELHSLLPNARLVYPLCHPKWILSFHHVTDLNELTPGKLGILEPTPAIHPETDLSDIDVFICPGLAFGRDHSRLGHGGGFYDRALTHRAKDAITIGVGFHIQLLNTVPQTKLDIPLDLILTDQGVVS